MELNCSVGREFHLLQISWMPTIDLYTLHFSNRTYFSVTRSEAQSIIDLLKMTYKPRGEGFGWYVYKRSIS